MKKNLVLAIVVIIAVVTFFGGGEVSQAEEITISELGLKDGDVVGSTDTSDPDLYIVNSHNQKRLFLNYRIFSLYGHLSAKNIKRISPDALDLLPTSGLFMVCEGNDRTVYALNPNGEDDGTLHRIEIDEAQLLQEDQKFYNKVFCINKLEMQLYQSTNQNFGKLEQVPVYRRLYPIVTTVPTNKQAPSITSVYPSSAEIGTTVTVQGYNLQVPVRYSVAKVKFNGYEVTNVLVRNDRSLIFTVPEYMLSQTIINCVKAPCSSQPLPERVPITPGNYQLTVEVLGRVSNAVTFTVTTLTNKPPVIDEVTGPTVLKIGQTGNWIVKAHDPENGSLRYVATWGDNYYKPIAESVPESLRYQQATSLSHVYDSHGIYTVIFLVHDDVGNVARTSMTVVVQGSLEAPTIIKVSPSSGPVGSKIVLEVYGITEYTNVYLNGMLAEKKIPVLGLDGDNLPQLLQFTVPEHLTSDPDCAYQVPACYIPDFAINVSPKEYKISIKNEHRVESNALPFTVVH